MISIERMKSLVTRRRISRVPFNSKLTQLRAVFGSEGVLSGQTIEWAGLAYSGKTSILHHWAKEVCSSGTGVAWIDSYRSLDARSFALIDCERFWVVRPVQEVDALFYADLLIRSCCFGLVIIEYLPELPLKKLRRLQRLAKMHDVVLVWLHASHHKRLEGVVSHRVIVSSSVKSTKQPLIHWCGPQVLIAMKNLKARGRHGTDPLMLVASEEQHLTPHLWSEHSDRRTSLPENKGGERRP